ncbi:MAG TPA: isochorismatase family cysteine hydrolase [Burkholderiaceae bacterium]|nr:isochorismatase family cysteine hydrolase [Burkholderiaceae bacterium]
MHNTTSTHCLPECLPAADDPMVEPGRRRFFGRAMSAAGLLALGAAQTACGGASAAPAPSPSGEPAWGGPIDPAKTAVLVMHYQSDILSFFSQAAPTLLANTRALLDAARARGTSVFFIRIAFSPSYLEVSPRNKNGSFLASTGAFLNNDIPAELARTAAEPVLVAKRVSVFFGTDLESRLSAKGIDTVVLAGIASTGVVLSTIAYASDADYRIYTVKDCCFDPDPVVHDHLFETAFESRSVVMSLAQATSALGGG